MPSKMTAAVYRGPRQIEVEDVDIPDVGTGDVLIAMKFCGICGSDVHSYNTGLYINPGQIMGHEFMGIASKVGSDVEGVSEGSRVTGFSLGVCHHCFWCKRAEYILCPDLFQHSSGYGLPGGFAEYVLIKNAVVGQSIHLLPDAIDDLSAATVEPVAVGVSAAEAAMVKPGDQVVVLGGGMIGNACLQAAKARGAAKVVLIEVSPIRLEGARISGADAVFDARTGDALQWVKETLGIGRYHFNEGGMADVVFEAAGSAKTIQQAFEMARSGGTVCFVGLPEGPVPFDTTKIVHKLLRVIGSLGGDFSQSIRELASGRIRTRDLITHQFPLDKTPEAFAVQVRSAESIKVMVQTGNRLTTP